MTVDFVGIGEAAQILGLSQSEPPTMTVAPRFYVGATDGKGSTKKRLKSIQIK